MNRNRNNGVQHQRDLTEKQVALALICVFILSTILARAIYAPCDDAYIFYVYAKNLVAGNGLTYNGSVVWGFTSILWTGALSLVGLLGIPLHVGGELLSTFSGWFALWATYSLGRSFGLRRLHALVPVILLAVTGDFAFYSAVGLEQVFFTGLIAVAAAFVVSKQYITIGGSVTTAGVMATMILTRPEGALVCALLLLVMLIELRSLIKPFLCGVLLLSFVAPFFLGFRFYFGDWLPNTFYAKSNAGLANISHGLQYLSWSLPRYWLVALLGAVVVVWAMVKRRFSSQLDAWSMVLITVLWLTYVTLQGGDNMVGGRVLIPALPLAYVVLVVFAPQLSSKRLTQVALLVCILLFSSYFMDSRVTKHRDNWRTSFDVRQSAGMLLRDNFPPKTLVALNPAGIIPYYSGLPTIDMLGLNDWYIAHNGKRDYRINIGHQAGDGDYVLSRQPDVILFGGSLSRQPGGYISDREIWASSLFHKDYVAVEWQGIGVAYIRRDFNRENTHLKEAGDKQ